MVRVTAVTRSEPAEPEGSLGITVNGEPREVPPGTSVADVVASLVTDPRGLAVAVDRTVVPRARWAETVMADGASVEVVTAAAGG